MDDEDMSFSPSWFGGDGTNVTDTSTDTGDTGWDASDTSANAPWAGGDSWDGTGGYSPGTEFGSDTSSDATGGTDSSGNVWGSVASGAAAGSAFGPWGTVIGAGLGLVSGFMKSKANSSDLKEKEKLDEKEYAAKKAIDEQYYQAHGKQLADAYQGYKKFNPAPGAPSATAQFGLVSPGGPSGYFH